MVDDNPTAGVMISGPESESIDVMNSTTSERDSKLTKHSAMMLKKLSADVHAITQRVKKV